MKGPKLDAVLKVLPHKYKAGLTSISLLSCVLSNAALYALSSHRCKGMLPLLPHVEFAFHQHPLACFMNLFCPRCRTFICLCWIVQGSCWPIPVGFLRSLWMAALTSSTLIGLLLLISSANLMKVCSVLLSRSRSLMKVLGSTEIDVTYDQLSLSLVNALSLMVQPVFHSPFKLSHTVHTLPVWL